MKFQIRIGFLTPKTISGLIILFFISGETGRAQQISNPVLPEPRIGHALVYHDSLRSTLLFGGRDSNGVEHADIWSWDGTRWTLIDDGSGDGPSPRSRFAMAYDQKRNRLVLQGGSTREEEFSDTWEWDGQSWYQCKPEGPGERSHHSMAYDAVNGEVILFGGGRTEDGSFLNDTWSWNGNRWKNVKTENPPGRILYAMASDPVRGGLFLFGGFGDEGMRYNELWNWNGSNWKLFTGTGPEPRISSALVYLKNYQSLLLYGGELQDELGGTWIFDGKRWNLLEMSPSNRTQHAMTYDSARDRVVLFGGSFDREYNNDLWEWNGAKWMFRE